VLRLSEVAYWFGVTAPEPDMFVLGGCIDSRRVRRGDLFVALPGKLDDGHDLLAEAKPQGAVASSDIACRARKPMCRGLGTPLHTVGGS
jgi:UDP-N-acetylmuramoyl-tripeptide--D-alanyl-D-alanine ligase